MVHVWDRRHVEVQDGQNALPAVRAARQRTRELLLGLAPAADLGCGTGTGALDLGFRAVGVDTSAVLAREARSRGVPVVQADVVALPFRTGSLSGLRCDRVLYHLTDPAAAVAEAHRVLRGGGRIVCAHPDHESMVLEVPGAPDHLIALAKRTRIELNYESGTVPRRVPRMLLDLGFDDVHTEAFTEVVEDPDAPSYAVPHWLRSWRRLGRIGLTDGDLAQWDAAVDAARRDGGFLFTLTYLVTYGTR